MLVTERTSTERKRVSTKDLGNYGLESLAYIKTVMIDGQKLHAIHAADGTQLTVMAERETAIATVRQHNWNRPAFTREERDKKRDDRGLP